jgi:hypothetical protein
MFSFKVPYPVIHPSDNLELMNENIFGANMIDSVTTK